MYRFLFLRLYGHLCIRPLVMIIVVEFLLCDILRKKSKVTTI